MQRTSTTLLVALALAVGQASAQLDWAAVTNQAAQQTGDGTFYGLGQDNQGTCSFSENFANTNSLPWSTGTALTLALNDAQFADSAACGMCIMYRGTGAGLGTTPIPATYTLGFVNNRCPECSKGDLDQATSGDGRWKVEWYAVPCNVGSSSLVYSIVVSSYYWFSLVVSNTRVPITGVSVQIGGSWLPLKRSNNNQWAYYNTNGPWQSSFPMGIQVTSITGETVTDSITAVSGNSGTVQFSAAGTGGGTPATPATAATTATSATAATSPVAAAAVATPPVVAATPVATPVQTPAAAPPQAPLPQGSFYVADYGQCGGNGPACNDVPYTSTPCTDAAWTTAVCSSPTFKCASKIANTWTCMPDFSIAVPPMEVHTAYPPSSLPSPVATPAATATPTSTAAAAVATSTPTAAAAVPPTAGNSAATQQDPTASLAATTPPAQTPPAAAATPTPTATATSTQTAAAAAQSTGSVNRQQIGAGNQCGGTTQCDPAGQATDKVTCNNGPWPGVTCTDGLSCLANPGPLIWTCMTPPVQSAGRRLLSR